MAILNDRLGQNPLHRIRNRIAAEILEEQWKVNYLVNKRYLTSASYRPFKDMFVEDDRSVAVIVGAGPSLKKNLDGLKEISHTWLFCTDKAFPTVVKERVPEYVCALNAKSPNREVCDWWRAGDTKTPTLIMPITADPITLDGWNGIFTFVNCGLPVDLTEKISQETGLNPIPGGSNVGIFAYLMATRLAFKKIVLIGMDYSFESRNDVLKKYAPQEPYIIFEHRDKEGRVRWSSWDWFDSAIAFFEYARFFGKNGIRTINCTEGGIVYDGEWIQDMSLKEAGRALN